MKFRLDLFANRRWILYLITDSVTLTSLTGLCYRLSLVKFCTDYDYRYWSGDIQNAPVALSTGKFGRLYAR
jgi:hypothetical protein